MKTRKAIYVAFAALILALFSIIVKAQTITFLTSGLKQPAKLIMTEKGNLLVAEFGFGAHDGRISIIDPQTGISRTLLDGLPSAAGRFNLAQGPSGLVMRGRTLYITIGEGNPTVACPPPCGQIPNPAGPASPIFSSVLALHFSAFTEAYTTGFTVTADDHYALKKGVKLELDNGGGDKAQLELIADFPDFAPSPRPGAPENVDASNPFGIEIIGNHVYVPDGGMNKVWKADIHSGEVESLVSFPTIIMPAGQRVEAVPAGIRVYNGQLLVALLRAGDSNPFGAGLAEIRIVDPQKGSDAPFITGLTSAIDVIPVQTEGAGDYFYVLQFGVFGPPVGPGMVPARLLRFNASGNSPANNYLIGSTASSMARDPVTGDFFMTRLFAGRIIRVQLP